RRVKKNIQKKKSTTGIERKAMSYRNERRLGRRRNRNGCLALLVALIWIILLAVVGYRYWLRPQVSQYVGRQIAEQVGAAGAAQGRHVTAARIEQGALIVTIER